MNFFAVFCEGGAEVEEDIVEGAASAAEGAEVVDIAATRPQRGQSTSSSCTWAAYPGISIHHVGQRNSN